MSTPLKKRTRSGSDTIYTKGQRQHTAVGTLVELHDSGSFVTSDLSDLRLRMCTCCSSAWQSVVVILQLQEEAAAARGDGQ